jgi:alanine-synthesizing transaminase
MRQRPLLDLSVGNPTEVGLSPPAELIATLLAEVDSARYTPHPFGLPEARKVIAAEFGLDAHNVMLTASTSEAYSHLFKLLCDPGDAVLVPSPSYPLFDVLAQLENIALIPYRIDYDGEWHLDADALRAANSGAVRAIITVHPNNPTGSFLKREELQAIAALGLPIISDEVFADYALVDDARRAVSALEAAAETLVFRLGGLSKACALPQLKLAWTSIAGPGSEEAIERLEHIADAYLSPGTPVQRALPKLLKLGPAIRAPILSRVKANLAQLRLALTDTPASVLKVEGGWYAVVRVPNTLDDEGWALTLLEHDHLVVQPGYYYELRNGVHIVLSLLPDPRDFAEAMPKLRARLLAG